MKKENGITLLSLTIYVIGFFIIIAIVTVITNFFYQNVVKMEDSSGSVAEYSKFNMMFLDEVKTYGNSVTDIGSNYVVFSSGNQYSFLDNKIYKNKIAIVNTVKACNFKLTTDGYKQIVSVYMELGDKNAFSKTTDYVLSYEEDSNIKIPIESTEDTTQNTGISAHTRYLVVDVFDTWGSNCAVINELEFYSDSTKRAYSIPNVYDSAAGGTPTYWSRDIWGVSNLQDGAINHPNNAVGKDNSTIFNYTTTSGAKAWSRFVIDFGGVYDINKIRICIGNGEYRIPKAVTFYVVENYNATNTLANNIKQRNDNGLQKLKEINFAQTLVTPTWFEY